MNKITLPLSIFIIVLTLSASAHGNTVGKQDKGYTIEFGIIEEPIQARSAGNIVLYLEDPQKERLPNIDAFVRVSRGNDIVFASTQLQSDASGAIPIMLWFETPGTYTVDATFEPDEKVKASFDFEVKGKTKSYHPFKYGLVLIILLIGIAIGYFIKNPKHEKPKKRTSTK